MVDNISFKPLFGSKPLRIRFNEGDGFIKVYGGTMHLVLFGTKKYDAIYNRIRYLISQKKVVFTYVIYHNNAKIKIYSHDSLLLEKTLILHNFI